VVKISRCGECVKYINAKVFWFFFSKKNAFLAYPGTYGAAPLAFPAYVNPIETFLADILRQD
jgi:hypothetical protein